MGCFYTGFDYKNRKNGDLKIGEVGKNGLGERMGSLRSEHNFQCLGYIKLINDTKAERLAIESFVRLRMSRISGLTHVGNDHFHYAIESKETKYTQAQYLANLALTYAKEACEMFEIKWEEGTRKYKRS